MISIAAKAPVNRNTVTAWRQASNVNVVPMRLCGPLRDKVAEVFAKSTKVRAVQSVVAATPRLSSSLRGYDAGNVFAAQQSGNQLTVYVY